MTEIKTKNIRNSMQSFASENLIPYGECDFNILKVDTYIKDSSNIEFRLFNEDVTAHYSDKEKILNENVSFQQLYTIEASLSSSSKLKLRYSIDYGLYSSHPKIILLPDSIIPYKEYPIKEIYSMLLQEINKIKVSHKILIQLFDQSMLKNIRALTKHIYAGKFNKRVRIPLFEGIEPEITKESKLIYWYKEKNVDAQVIEIDKDEVLVEFIKPIYGKKGFSAYGEILGSDFANNKEDLNLELDSSIEVFEDVHKKLYKSKVKGFVHIINNKLIVDNKLKKSKLSRNESKLAEDEDNNIEVFISQNDASKDSVGEGVELVSETIHIKGHIGANSIIEANTLQIDGATHQDSTQFAKFATINRHKGTLRCHDAKIALLEGGEVHATNVEIESSLGGIIYAQTVKIGHVKNNLKVYASESIEINLVSGEDNTFKINYKDIPILISKLDLIDEDIEELKFQLEEATRHNKLQTPIIEEKIQKFRDAKEQILNSSFNAKISIKQAFRGLNNIIFTINARDELIYKTQAQEYEPFHLEISPTKITLIPTTTSIKIEE